MSSIEKARMSGRGGHEIYNDKYFNRFKQHIKKKSKYILKLENS